MQQKMVNVMEKLMNTTIYISAAWQQMYQVNQALTTFVNIIMTMQQTVLFIHVLIESIFNISTPIYYVQFLAIIPSNILAILITRVHNRERSL